MGQNCEIAQMDYPELYKILMFNVIRFSIYHCAILTVGGDMVKRFICIVLVSIMLIIPFAFTAFAGGADEIIWFVLDQYYDWSRDTIDDVKNMTPTEYVQWMFDNGNFDSQLWNATIIAWQNMTLNNPVSTPWGSYGGKPYNVTLDGIADAANGVYRTAQVTRDVLESSVNNFNGEIRYYTLSDLGLTSPNGFTSGFDVTGSEFIPEYTRYPFVPSNPDCDIIRYHRDTSITDRVLVYGGSSYAAPLFYVPYGVTLYQNGVALPHNSFYTPISSNELMRCGTPADTYSYCYSVDGGNPATTEFNAIRDSVAETGMWIYYNGHCVGYSGTSPYTNISMVDVVNKMRGYIIHYDDTPPATVTLPDDIPYDDDDTVIVLIPQPGTGGDTIYMSPHEFKQYVDNGDITYANDYTDCFDNETVNNIINNYNNNGGSSGGGTFNFDDSRIVDRLDKIISKLRDILEEMRYSNLSKLEPTDFSDLIGDIFSSDDDFVKSEVDWRTLLETKFIIFKQCRQLIEELQNRNSPLILEAKNPIGTLLSAFPGYDSSKYADSQNFVVNVNWFEKQYTSPMGTTKSGREYVRDGIGFILYGITFAYIYRRTDSILADF